jgi:hypothetical protein
MSAEQRAQLNALLIRMLEINDEQMDTLAHQLGKSAVVGRELKALQLELQEQVEEEEEEEDDEEEEEDEDEEEEEEFFSCSSSSCSDEVVLRNDDSPPLPPTERKRSRSSPPPERFTRQSFMPKLPRRLYRKEEEEEEEDIEEDDDEDEDQDAELSFQLPEFRGWRRRIRGAVPQATTWNELRAQHSVGWFARRYLAPLEMIRGNLGPENANLHTIQARWDTAFSETRALRPPLVNWLPGARPGKCALCGGTKTLTYEVDVQGWLMGYHCAQLFKAWVDWCKALQNILSPPPEEDEASTLDQLKSLDAALEAVKKAHAGKSSKRVK